MFFLITKLHDGPQLFMFYDKRDLDLAITQGRLFHNVRYLTQEQLEHMAENPAMWAIGEAVIILGSVVVPEEIGIQRRPDDPTL